MFKRFLPFIIVFLAANASSQTPDIILNRIAEQNPIEKLYLHLDRDNYIAGESIWFKAYHYTDFLPGKKATTIFVELLDASSRLIEQKTTPVFEGTGHGQFELPVTLPAGIYFLRAYSPTMLNYDAGFTYIKRINISGKNTQNTIAAQKPAATRIEFFPEGGNFVTGLSNTIAYKATNEAGLPVAVSGLVKNEANETVAEFSSYHDGMGFFDLVPQGKNTYYIILNGDPAAKKYMLPPQSAKGIILKVISSGKTKSFEILQHTGDPAFEVAYMIGQMQHNTAFKTSFPEKKNRLTGNIQTEDFPSGILHITAFNKDGIPLAERLTFVNNREYIQGGELTIDTLDFSEKGKNVFTLSLKDTVQGSFSMAVTDAAFEYLPKRTENILSGLLLTADIKGYVHDPAYYFSSDADTVANALDLVMMTNGWRRFKWTTIDKDFPATPVYKDPGYITLTGKVNIEGTKKPFADKELLTLIVAADSSRTLQMVRTNAKGQYRLDSLFFFDKANIFINDPKRKGRKFIDVFGDEHVLSKPYVLPGINTGIYPLPAAIYTTTQQRLIDNEYDAITKANGLLLKGITVKSRPKTRQEEFEEKNVSALFTGGDVRSLSLLGKPTVGYANILDYLQARLPGLEVRKMNFGEYRIGFRLTSSFSSSPVPTIFLDEALSDVSMLAALPAEQVALVKMYSHFVATPGGGIGGVLAVYTKKAADLKLEIPSTGDVLKYKGYSVIKEFYSPDYSVDTLKNANDKRITLLWSPDIWVSDINPNIPVSFYNNDRTRLFKVVVEGMSSTGKLFFIEKILKEKTVEKPF